MWPFNKNKKKQKNVKKTKKRYSHSKDEHNFDKELTDEEFFEVMEDD